MPGQDCVLCGGRSRDAMVCAPCIASLPEAPPMAGAVARFDYRFPVDRLVQRFKYAGDLAVGRWLGGQLARRVASEEAPQLLVPIALTPARLRGRGFNQAAHLARVVSRQIGVPVALGLLERTRDAPAQSALDRRARRANLRGAFRCKSPYLEARHVALVDDVVTTGATCAAAAIALKRAGVERVDVWAVARTPHPGDG